MTAYLTLDEFKTRTVMPSEDVDALEAAYAGFIASKLSEHSSRIDARLRKRYVVPFASPTPEIVLSWVERLTTKDAYLKRGFNPSSEQDAEIIARAKAAEDEIKEAADANEGLFDLPLREDVPGTSGVSQGGPFGYSEQSPYTWMRKQREAASDE